MNDFERAAKQTSACGSFIAGGPNCLYGTQAHLGTEHLGETVSNFGNPVSSLASCQPAGDCLSFFQERRKPSIFIVFPGVFSKLTSNHHVTCVQGSARFINGGCVLKVSQFQQNENYSTRPSLAANPTPPLQAT